MAPTEKAKRLRKKAEKGSATAYDQLDFGLLYYIGDEGVKRNLATAVEWIGKAAAQGLAEARNCLGKLYMTDLGTEGDKRQAVVWWRKAASQELTNDLAQQLSVMQAKRRLANCYLDGGEGTLRYPLEHSDIEPCPPSLRSTPNPLTELLT
jgi:TPR repeat protein